MWGATWEDTPTKLSMFQGLFQVVMPLQESLGDRKAAPHIRIVIFFLLGGTRQRLQSLATDHNIHAKMSYTQDNQ